ncbi:MAG: gliding motility-associated C-terminal domain-containing protein, partial [Phaeodactylibacter sp.]|nr:gliding motility-associated C-terminal domain-containing protein [Phaeodactylibacter sp.]
MIGSLAVACSLETVQIPTPMSCRSFTLRFLVLFLLFTLSSGVLWATHNRAGEITVRLVDEDCAGPSGLTIEATITTYTKASSIPADRDTLTICWGDGTCQRVARTNGPGTPPQGDILENDTKRNFYVATHTYPARATYTISMTDPNRNGGILNVNFPNSDQVRFHIQTEYTFLNPQFQGCNNSPQLLQPPIDIGCVGRVFTHNPNAFDADNDSLTYEFITPMQDVNTSVPNYQEVTAINAGANNQITIDRFTGDIVWDAPQRRGEYNIAILIREYRNGQQIGSIVRDMQILVEECENLPPVVEVPFDEVCVIAGNVLEFDVRATAPLSEEEQLVRLTALGGPFELPYGPATFTPNTETFEEDPVVKTFRWDVPCEAISAQFYQVVFKATDNGFGDTTGLATLKTVRIKVVGPPPEDVQAEPESNQVNVSWQLPYACEETENDYFQGFTVWRREGNANFVRDTCTPGLDGSGYTKLFNDPIMDVADGRYVYTDTDVERGRTYCYRILAEFALTTPTGSTTYNPVESLASDSVCVQLNRDIPLITNVSVLTTDTGNGEMEVCWSKPVAEDLDTLLNPGPYVYEVLRAEGQNPPDDAFLPTGTIFTSDFFANANDTCFVDTGLNTSAISYSYKVAFYVNNETEPLGLTNPASSVFLTIEPTDNTNILSWSENVPWTNFNYTIFRENDLGGFDSIATVLEPPYRDEGLINGTEYCYYVRSAGTYGIDGLASPLLNNAQRDCSIPIDNIAPCPPTLEVTNGCDTQTDCSDEESLANTLNWVNPMDLCEETDDVVGYRIYYAPVEGSDFEFIASIDDSRLTVFDHKPEIGIAGCYAVTAIDTFLNESDFSNIICVDNCPFYQLPNAFTPNGDGQNDVFRPYPYCFIDRVEFTVFNRWGQVVFTTNDPDLNWDGNNLQGQL